MSDQSIFTEHFIEESYNSHGCRPITEDRLQSAHTYCEQTYGQEFVMRASPQTYLIRGVVLSFTKQGPRHFKEAQAWSNNRETLDTLLKEIGIIG